MSSSIQTAIDILTNKSSSIEELKKALEYIQDEIDFLSKIHSDQDELGL
jgi:hypothetical protein